MDIHQNALLSFRSRERLALYVLRDGGTRKAAAAAFRVSAKTVAKWVGRFQREGRPGLLDRSSRPLRSPGSRPSSSGSGWSSCAASVVPATPSRGRRG